MPKKDPWADRPDRFDRADREWASRWAAPKDDGDEPEPPGPGYQNEKVTVDRLNDAYGDGMRAAGPHLGFGLQLGAAMVFFVGMGLLVDRWLDTTPWGVIAGATLGMVGIMTLVMRMARGDGS